MAQTSTGSCIDAGTIARRNDYLNVDATGIPDFKSWSDEDILNVHEHPNSQPQWIQMWTREIRYEGVFRGIVPTDWEEKMEAEWHAFHTTP
jgi:hypothetical protein